VSDEAAAVRHGPNPLLRRAATREHLPENGRIGRRLRCRCRDRRRWSRARCLSGSRDGADREATADGRDNEQHRDDPGVAERQGGARARPLGTAWPIRCLWADEFRRFRCGAVAWRRRRHHIASRRRMRSAIGGCVSKSPSMARGASFSGFAKYKDAVALLATSSASLSAAILRSALASPGGYRVSRAPDASARYSRCLETANWMSIAMIGVSIASTTAMIRMTPPPPPRSRPRRPPPNAKERNIQSESRAIVPTSTVTRS